MYINHITLSTGHVRRSPRGEVTDETLQALRPWLQAALAAPHPLPGPLGQAYALQASVQDGALLGTVLTVPAGTPLVSFAVAQRSRQAGQAWALMCARHGCQAGLLAPPTPWCAVALHPALLHDVEATGWLGDFERCVAWAWIKHE